MADCKITAKPLLTASYQLSAPVTAQTQTVIRHLNNQSALNSKQTTELMNILFRVVGQGKEYMCLWTLDFINAHTYYTSQQVDTLEQRRTHLNA